jgi:LemA protein
MTMLKRFSMLLAVTALLVLSGCGYNALQQQDEQIKAAWSAKVGSIQATPELLADPQAFARFQAAQGELSGALSRLLVVAESYPQLKSDANFRDLQAQLEGTENRITVARNRYIKSVQEFNITVRSFPTNLTAMMFGHKEKPQFTVENEREISKPPTVDFGTPPSPTRDRAASPRPDASATK